MTYSPAVEDAIRREQALGELLVRRYRSKLKRFEEEHGMASETFKERFQQGDLGDDEDYFEWVAALKALKHWEEKLSDLRAAG